MSDIKRRAPMSDQIVDYDHRNLALYAALLEADDAGQAWREAASLLMQLDVARDDAEACWRSHLERARWIVGDGLGRAIAAFGKSQQSTCAGN